VKKIFLGFLVLNLLLEGLAAALLIGDQIPPMVIHAVMAAIAIVLYSQRSKYTT